MHPLRIKFVEHAHRVQLSNFTELRVQYVGFIFEVQKIKIEFSCCVERKEKSQGRI